MDIGRLRDVELNLCPGCNAFVNKGWATCPACGFELNSAEPVAAQPAAETVEASEPAEGNESVESNESEGFTVRWSSPFEADAARADSFTTAGGGVATAGADESPAVPESTTNVPPQVPVPVFDDEFTVPINWSPRTTASPSAPEPVSTITTPFISSPSPGIRFAPSFSATDDGRLAPALSKKTILFLALTGPLAILFLIAVVTFIGGEPQQPIESTTVISPGDAASLTDDSGEPQASATTDWVRFEDAGGAFRVDLPGPPSAATDSSSGSPVKTWTSKTADGHAIASVVAGDLPDGTDWEENQQVLKNALKGTSDASGMAVTGQVITKSEGRYQLDARLSSAEGAIDVRYFVHGKTLYGLSLISDNASGNAALFDKLTKSFEKK